MEGFGYGLVRSDDRVLSLFASLRVTEGELAGCRIDPGPAHGPAEGVFRGGGVSEGTRTLDLQGHNLAP